LAGVSVLIVDDNLTNRKVLTEMVLSWGMQPTPASSVHDAMAHIRLAAGRLQPFAIVLTDLHMPELSGFDLVTGIQSSPAFTKAVVLMLTSGEHGGDLARCRELGISAYLTKPVRRAELRTAIVKALANQSNGNSRIGRPDELATDAVGKNPTGMGCHILLAEDNIINQRVARGILEKAGHSVIVASNGRKAVELFEQQAFDLILMDVQMAEMDGFEATAAIRASEKGTGVHNSIVAMTAHAMAGDRERCITAGMDNYITKPIHATALLELVEKFSKGHLHR
jgi:CheY-like chemotaxis protein